MHIGAVMIFEGPAPSHEEFTEHISERLHLVPRYRQKLALPAHADGAAAVDRRSQLQPRLPRPLHRAAEARRDRAAEAADGPDLLPAPRPDQAAVGDLADRRARGRPLRADQQDPPLAGRRRLGRGHHDGPVRPRQDPGRGPHSPTASGRPGPSPRTPTSSPGGSRTWSRRRSASRSAPSRRPPSRSRQPGSWAAPPRAPARCSGARSRAPPSARSTADRDPPPGHLGGRGPGGAEGDQERARRHRQRRLPGASSPAP